MIYGTVVNPVNYKQPARVHEYDASSVGVSQLLQYPIVQPIREFPGGTHFVDLDDGPEPVYTGAERDQPE